MTATREEKIEGLDPIKFAESEAKALEQTGAYLSSLGRNLGYNMKVHVSKPNEEDKHFMFEKFEVLIAEENDTQFRKPILLVGSPSHFSKPLDDQEMKSLIDSSIQPNDALGNGFKAIFQKYSIAKEFYSELSASLAKSTARSKSLKI